MEDSDDDSFVELDDSSEDEEMNPLGDAAQSVANQKEDYSSEDEKMEPSNQKEEYVSEDDEFEPLGNATHPAANQNEDSASEDDKIELLGNAEQPAANQKEDASDDAKIEPAGDAAQPGVMDCTMHHDFKLDGEDMVTARQRLLPVLSVWASKNDLKEIINKYGLLFGFKIAEHGWTFTCNKAGSTRDRPDKQKSDLPEDKRRKGNRSLKVGCAMCVRYTYLDRKNVKTSPIKITFSNFQHTGNCHPSPNQLLVARKASGDYCKLSMKCQHYFFLYLGTILE
jgi:hypothetical protein